MKVMEVKMGNKGNMVMGVTQVVYSNEGKAGNASNLGNTR